MSKVKTEFEKNPVAILETSLEYYTSNKKMTNELKEDIKDSIEHLTKVPEGIAMEIANSFLEVNIFDHDLKDLVECGVYNYIYSKSLSIVAGSRVGGAE